MLLRVDGLCDIMRPVPPMRQEDQEQVITILDVVGEVYPLHESDVRDSKTCRGCSRLMLKCPSDGSRLRARPGKRLWPGWRRDRSSCRSRLVPCLETIARAQKANCSLYLCI